MKQWTLYQSMKPPPNLETTQRPRSSPLTATQWENEWWRCHSFKPWMGSAWAAECVCHFEPWNERFFPVIIVSLIAPMASLTAGSQLPVFWSWVKDWQLTNCSLRPGLVTTHGPALANQRLRGGYQTNEKRGKSAGRLLPRVTQTWELSVGKPGQSFLLSFSVFSQDGRGGEVTEGLTHACRTKDVQMSCWI